MRLHDVSLGGRGRCPQHPMAPGLPQPAHPAQLEPLRLALGEDLEGLSIEGTAFYALQSCCNHSCEPAAAAEGGPSGAARILALRRIATGEEVTLSYIQEEGAGLEARRAALAAYGFVCRCGRCEAEALAGELAAGAGGSA